MLHERLAMWKRFRKGCLRACLLVSKKQNFNAGGAEERGDAMRCTIILEGEVAG